MSKLCALHTQLCCCHCASTQYRTRRQGNCTRHHAHRRADPSPDTFPHLPAPSRSYQRLLEASRHWIRQDEWGAAVERAVDNPEPFGFITNLKVTRGF